MQRSCHQMEIPLDNIPKNFHGINKFMLNRHLSSFFFYPPTSSLVHLRRCPAVQLQLSSLSFSIHSCKLFADKYGIAAKLTVHCFSKRNMLLKATTIRFIHSKFCTSQPNLTNQANERHEQPTAQFLSLSSHLHFTRARESI